MVDFELISLFLFFVVVGIFIWKNRKNVEFKYGILINKWKGGLEKIDKIVEKHEKFVKILGTIGIIASLVSSFYAIYFLILRTFEREPVIGFLLPTVAGYEYPRPIIGVNFWFWIISIFILLISHETMHAVFARLAKIKIKDYGILFLFILPIGAFVNIEKEEIKKLKLLESLRIFAAGSFGNFIVAGVIFALILVSLKTFELFAEPIGIEYEVIKDTPAHEAGLKGRIVEIDGEKIRNLNDLRIQLNKKRPGEKIEIVTNVSIYEITTIPHPENETKAFIGIANLTTIFVNKITNSIIPFSVLRFTANFLSLFFWIFAINFAVGMANLLPIKLLDGYYIFERIFSKIFGEKNGHKITNFFSLLTIFLVITNILIAIKLI